MVCRRCCCQPCCNHMSWVKKHIIGGAKVEVLTWYKRHVTCLIDSSHQTVPRKQNGRHRQTVVLPDRRGQAWGQQISYFEFWPPLRLCSPWFSTLTALREQNKENPQDLSHSDQRKKIDLFALENPREIQCSLFIFFFFSFQFHYPRKHFWRQETGVGSKTSNGPSLPPQGKLGIYGP